MVSCRYAGWSGEVQGVEQALFEPLDVHPFDDAQITRLVELWFREVGRRGYLEPAVAAERVAQLTRALTHPEHRRQDFLVLVSTPLLLTLLCLVVMRGGEIPRRRVDFFEECLRILLREWRARQTQREPPVSSERALKLLGALAWQLHRGHRRDDLTFPQALALLSTELGDRRRAAQVFNWLLEDVALLDRYTDQILRSLDGQDQGEIDRLWAREAEERIDAFERREIAAIDGKRFSLRSGRAASDEASGA